MKLDPGFCWSLSISCLLWATLFSEKKGGMVLLVDNVSPLYINPYRLERALLAGLSRNIRHTDDRSRSQNVLSSDVPCSVERVLDTPLPDVACFVDSEVKYSTIHRSTNIAIIGLLGPYGPRVSNQMSWTQQLTIQGVKWTCRLLNSVWNHTQGETQALHTHLDKHGMLWRTMSSDHNLCDIRLDLQVWMMP